MDIFTMDGQVRSDFILNETLTSANLI